LRPRLNEIIHARNLSNFHASPGGLGGFAGNPRNVWMKYFFSARINVEKDSRCSNSATAIINRELNACVSA